MEVCSRFDNHLIENRQVRIFLSSTFSDMQKERTELVKTFEILKVEAAKRDVALSVVDLRWGVTEEEAKTGKVISICLEEIEHSHPFFIGILGNNYGTAPKREELKNNPELNERYEWLNDAITNDENGMSITEMEIQYGVLKNNKKDIDAAFYFRDSDEPDNNKRLTHLKDDIREYCRSKGRDDLPQDYSEVSELCGYVMEEVRNVINKHFPETKEVTLLDRDRSAQKAYINSRHSNYHERQSYYDTIDGFVRNNTQHHLVFTGASGIGKSALLANWIIKNEKNPDFNLIYHFVGNSFSGNNYENVLRHICDEIYELYSIRKDDNRNEKIEDEAQRLVVEVSQRDKQLIVVIDGINQIVTQGPGKEKLLLWLPSASKNVKYIFSTLPGDETMETFERRKYKVETLEPLSDKELIEWIPRYLIRVGKELNYKKEQLQRIVKWSLSDVIQGNMLVLRTLLDELTRFGVYEKVDERIDYYTSSTSIPEFFDRVLSCLEKDYSPEKDLVKHALILIAVSEHGLSEDELMTILGCQKCPLEWKLFFCAFYNHFVIKNGLIAFSHRYIVDAIKKRYCTEDPNETAPYRLGIIEGLKSPNIDPENDSAINRMISEYAHQYYNLCDRKNLYLVLTCQGAFNYFYEIDQSLLAKYWRALLEESSKQYPLISYLQLSKVEKDKPKDLFFSQVALFIEEFFPSKENLQIALKYHKSALSIRKNYPNPDKLQIAQSINNIGGIYDSLGDFCSALGCYLYSLDIKRDLYGTGNCLVEQAVAYDNIGHTYREMGELSIAEEYHFDALSIKEHELGYKHLSTAISYGNLGGVFFDKGQMNDDKTAYQTALYYFKKAYNIESELLGYNNLRALVTLDNILCASQEVEDGEELNKRYENLLRMLISIYGQNHVDVAKVYWNLGRMYYRKAEKVDSHSVEEWKDCINDSKHFFELAYGIIKEKMGEDSSDAHEIRRWIIAIDEKI